MGRYFFDSSALIKRYLNDEPGHAWVAALCAPQAGNDIHIAEATSAEVVAAFCRMARMTPAGSGSRNVIGSLPSFASEIYHAATSSRGSIARSIHALAISV